VIDHTTTPLKSSHLHIDCGTQLIRSADHFRRSTAKK
jgi:hypothetical protein